MDNERLNQIENTLDRINNMYVDTSYIQMLNGFNELDRGELIETIKDIWRFASIKFECPVKEYKTFMNENIRNRFVHLKCMYTEYRNQLLNEMVEYLNKVLVNVKFKDESKRTILMEPCFDLQNRQFIFDDKHKWDLLKNVDIYEHNKEQDDFLKGIYVETWKKTFKEREDSFKRTFGLKYSDVENWSYEKWFNFAIEYKRENHKMPRMLKQNKDKKPAHRPQEQHVIKMIDIETEEVFERFNCRQAVIDTIGVKKNTLSDCIKTSKTNPNAKSTWRKYKYDGRKYWFVEEN